jgi:hypothetical protein
MACPNFIYVLFRRLCLNRGGQYVVPRASRP